MLIMFRKSKKRSSPRLNGRPSLVRGSFWLDWICTASMAVHLLLFSSPAGELEIGPSYQHPDRLNGVTSDGVDFFLAADKGNLVRLPPGWWTPTNTISVLSIGFTNDLHAIHHTNNTFYVAGSSGVIFESTNLIHWRKAFTSRNPLVRINHFVKTQHALVAVGNHGTILRKTSARDWHLIATHTDFELQQAIAAPSGALYAIAKSLHVLRSIDGGLSWYTYFTPSVADAASFVVAVGASDYLRLTQSYLFQTHGPQSSTFNAVGEFAMRDPQPYGQPRVICLGSETGDSSGFVYSFRVRPYVQNASSAQFPFELDPDIPWFPLARVADTQGHIEFALLKYRREHHPFAGELGLAKFGGPSILIMATPGEVITAHPAPRLRPGVGAGNWVLSGASGAHIIERTSPGPAPWLWEDQFQIEHLGGYTELQLPLPTNGPWIYRLRKLNR